jgi:hypothetical protein
MDPNSLFHAAQPWVARVAAVTGLTASTIVATLMLLFGLGIALLLRGLTRRLVRRGGRLMHGLQARGSEVPSTERIERAAGEVVYWLVVVFAVMAATETLGLPVVTAWLSGIASFFPRVVAAGLIVVFGTVAARLTRRLVARTASSAKLPSSDRLARAAELAILVGSGLVAADELGIEISFLKSSLLIVLGATLGGLALGLALGGRDLIANILSAHYVHKLYGVGQTVRIGETEGRILRITETFVVLECAEGSVAVPARSFSDMRSTMILKRSEPR